ncbi:unnamed protein product [Sympodiomycopsis kandeliae]
MMGSQSVTEDFTFLWDCPLGPESSNSAIQMFANRHTVEHKSSRSAAKLASPPGTGSPRYFVMSAPTDNPALEWPPTAEEAISDLHDAYLSQGCGRGRDSLLRLDTQAGQPSTISIAPSLRKYR